MKTRKSLTVFTAAVLIITSASFSLADDDEVPYNVDKEVYFGTTHGHSSWSPDAFGLGNQKAGPEDGYRFARGEAVSHMGGAQVQLKQPLDFFCMTDHSEMMGAISHNGNSSIGKMFGPLDSNGDFITAAYAKRRSLNEPLHEAGQTKGVSMAHPMFSPNDEWANFELWNYLLPTGAPIPAMRGNYVREAWKMGLNLERVLGVNPFKFGVEGGSDTHSTINPFEEFNFAGGHATADNTAKKRILGRAPQPMGVVGGNQFTNPGTLTGAWAESNTREAIYDSLLRKEVYATSGTRIKVRFFGGYGYEDDLLDKGDWIKTAYDGGVPMGADLPPNPDGTSVPKFAVWALNSPHSGNLDRIQIIKLWTDGVMDYEKIYDVALSDGRKVDPETGEAQPVGNTVDVTTATYTNDIGDVDLKAVWTDPDFDPNTSAVYYVRVLEIPTPRWSTYDAVALGLPPSDLVPATIQERAWSSPIWYAGVAGK